MSIKIMTMVWDKFPGSGSELLAILAMTDWCNDAGGSLYPSVDTLAKKIRVSESQARRILHKLIEDGYLSVVGNAMGGKPGASRHYQVNVKMLKELPDIEATVCTDARGSMDARDGSHGCAPTGSTHDTLTTIEPPIEPPSIGKKLIKQKKDYSGDPLFVLAMEQYPTRAGGNSKTLAFKAWNARLKTGASRVDMLEGVKRYYAYIQGTGKIDTEYVMQAATFFGPANRYTEEYKLPSLVTPKADSDRMRTSYDRTQDIEAAKRQQDARGDQVDPNDPIDF